MATHRLTLDVEVDDEHENASDGEWWADAAAGALRGYRATEVIYRVTGPVCSKCDDVILSPLGVEGERCPLCGDEPAAPADLLALLQAAVGPLVRLRDYLAGQAPGSWETDVYGALERALDDVDSAVRTLEAPEVEGPCRFCDDEGPHEGMCCEVCFDVLADEGAWDLPLDQQRDLVAEHASSERRCSECGESYNVTGLVDSGRCLRCGQ